MLHFKAKCYFSLALSFHLIEFQVCINRWGYDDDKYGRDSLILLLLFFYFWYVTLHFWVTQIYLFF